MSTQRNLYFTDDPHSRTPERWHRVKASQHTESAERDMVFYCHGAGATREGNNLAAVRMGDHFAIITTSANTQGAIHGPPPRFLFKPGTLMRVTAVANADNRSGMFIVATLADSDLQRYGCAESSSIPWEKVEAAQRGCTADWNRRAEQTRTAGKVGKMNPAKFSELSPGTSYYEIEGNGCR